MSKAGGSKKSGGAAFEAKRGEFRGFLGSVGEVRCGELHFGESLGQLGVWLVRSCNFAWQVACRRAAHAKWKDGLARDAIEQERVTVFRRDRDDVDALSVARDRREVWWGRNIA